MQSLLRWLALAVTLGVISSVGPALAQEPLRPTVEYRSLEAVRDTVLALVRRSLPRPNRGVHVTVGPVRFKYWGDGTDPTYVPDPGCEMTATCIPRRNDDILR